MNHEMDAAFAAEGVERHFEVHPGTHSGTYWNAYLRSQLEAQVAAFGSGGTPPRTFSYRSADPRFAVWGWSFAVDRPAEELLTVRDASCEGLTLEGSGRVLVAPPARCGVRPVTVEVAGTRRVDLR